MAKRYALFAWVGDQQNGGWNDLVDTFAERDDVDALAYTMFSEIDGLYFQVVDLYPCEVVFSTQQLIDLARQSTEEMESSADGRA